MIIENEREVKVMPKVKCERLENVVESGLRWSDLEKIQEVNELLHTLQHKFGDYIQLQDLNTGEILDVEELARVRGILSMLANSRVFQMSLK
jgi:hypothetical protein